MTANAASAQGRARPPWRYAYWGSVYLPVIKAQNPIDPSAAGLPMATVWYVPPPLIPFHLPVPEKGRSTRPVCRERPRTLR